MQKQRSAVLALPREWEGEGVADVDEMKKKFSRLQDCQEYQDWKD